MSSSVLLLGDPISGSLSPAIQNVAFEALGIDCRYVLREVKHADLAGAIAELRADDRVVGANVTIPHKESVMPLLDDLDPLAARIGAVNTISKYGASLRGWNTDVQGFLRALAESPSRRADNSLPRVRGRVGWGPTQGGGYARVALIGAGGAARAVAAALQPTAEMWVIARNLEQARRLCQDLDIERGGPVDMNRMQQTVATADLVVNATPADLPPASWLRPDQRVFDLRTSRSAEGRAMLLYQGAASFEIWTGRKAPVDVMRAALGQEVVPA